MAKKKKNMVRSNIWQLVFVVLTILGFRIMFVDVYSGLQERVQFETVDYLALFFGNTWAIVLTCVVDFFSVRLLNKHISIVEHSVRHFWIDLILVLAISLLGLIPIYIRELLQASFTGNYAWHMIFSYLTLVLVNLVFISVLELAFFYRKSRKIIREEQDKTRQSQYKYNLLKQQLNPHFLFNSLNILNYLVQSGEKERASGFIHKLAGVYRYFLNVESTDMIDLRSERDFVTSYCDLLKERFPEGLLIDIDIPENYLNSSVVPLSLQMLVENAVKHNIVNKEHPLHIRIGIADNQLFVSNNVQPRLSIPSTGVGQKNIKQQYQILTGKGISIMQTDDTYTVSLPLIN